MIREGTWAQLRIAPHRLVKLVLEGKATIIGYDEKKRTIYRLDDVREESSEEPKE
jgi:hypothetical protein